MSEPGCGCPTIPNGDMRCHVCGEYVNVRCWNCKTPRGEGSCPSPKSPVSASPSVPTTQGERDAVILLCGPGEVGFGECWFCADTVPEHVTDKRFCSHECAAGWEAEAADALYREDDHEQF